MTTETAHSIWILFAFGIVPALGVTAAVIASRKQRSSGAWFVLGIVFPLLGVLIISALEPLPSQVRPSFYPPPA